MSDDKEGTAGVTQAELDAAKVRPHPIDTKPFVDGVRKIIKSHKAGTKNMIRINIYSFKELHDGWMLKLNITKYIEHRSAGPRWVKGYLSEAKKVEFEKVLDALPRKQFTDTRDNSTFLRPKRDDHIHRDAPTDLDLANLWDTTVKD